MLKLKTQLDIVKYSLWVQNFSARGRPGGVGLGLGFAVLVTRLVPIGFDPIQIWYK